MSERLDRLEKFLEESSKRADKRQAEYEARQAKLDAMFEKSKVEDAKRQAEYEARQAKIDEQFAKSKAEYEARQAKADEQMAELKSQMVELKLQVDKTTKTVDKLGKLFGGFTNNQGDMVERFVSNSIAQAKSIYDIQFDYIDTNIYNRIGSLKREYDIVAYNGDTIAIVEVKSKAHVNDLNSFQDKIRDFRVLFPMYERHKIVIGIASLDVNKEIIKACEDRGYMAFKIAGEVIERKGLKVKVY